MHNIRNIPANHNPEIQETDFVNFQISNSNDSSAIRSSNISNSSTIPNIPSFNSSSLLPTKGEGALTSLRTGRALELVLEDKKVDRTNGAGLMSGVVANNEDCKGFRAGAVGLVPHFGLDTASVVDLIRVEVLEDAAEVGRLVIGAVKDLTRGFRGGKVG